MEYQKAEIMARDAPRLFCVIAGYALHFLEWVSCTTADLHGLHSTLLMHLFALGA
jgi:hypothetical protein